MGSHFLLPQTHHTESAINVRMTLAMSRLFQPFSPRIIALIPPLVPPVPRHPRQTRSVPPRRQSDHQSALAAARGSRKLQEWAVRGRTTDGGADEPGENPVKEGRRGERSAAAAAVADKRNGLEAEAPLHNARQKDS